MIRGRVDDLGSIGWTIVFKRMEASESVVEEGRCGGGSGRMWG